MAIKHKTNVFIKEITDMAFWTHWNQLLHLLLIPTHTDLSLGFNAGVISAIFYAHVSCQTNSYLQALRITILCKKGLTEQLTPLLALASLIASSAHHQ